jgi:hypothetical protein
VLYFNYYSADVSVTIFGHHCGIQGRAIQDTADVSDPDGTKNTRSSCTCSSRNSARATLMVLDTEQRRAGERRVLPDDVAVVVLDDNGNSSISRPGLGNG